MNKDLIQVVQSNQIVGKNQGNNGRRGSSFEKQIQNQIKDIKKTPQTQKKDVPKRVQPNKNLQKALQNLNFKKKVGQREGTNEDVLSNSSSSKKSETQEFAVQGDACGCSVCWHLTLEERKEIFGQRFNLNTLFKPGEALIKHVEHEHGMQNGPLSPRSTESAIVSAASTDLVRRTVFIRQRQFEWLIHKMIPPSNLSQVAGCELNFPDTAFFRGMGNQAADIVKTDPATGCLTQIEGSYKLNVTELRTSFTNLVKDRFKETKQEKDLIETRRKANRLLTMTKKSSLTRQPSVLVKGTVQRLPQSRPNRHKGAINNHGGTSRDTLSAGQDEAKFKLQHAATLAAEQSFMDQRNMPIGIIRYKPGYGPEGQGSDYQMTKILNEVELYKQLSYRNTDPIWNYIESVQSCVKTRKGLGKHYYIRFRADEVNNLKELVSFDKFEFDFRKADSSYAEEIQDDIEQLNINNNFKYAEIQKEIERRMKLDDPEAYCRRVCLKMGFYLQTFYREDLVQMDCDFFQDDNKQIWLFNCQNIITRRVDVDCSDQELDVQKLQPIELVAKRILKQVKQNMKRQGLEVDENYLERKRQERRLANVKPEKMSKLDQLRQKINLREFSEEIADLEESGELMRMSVEDFRHVTRKLTKEQNQRLFHCMRIRRLEGIIQAMFRKHTGNIEVSKEFKDRLDKAKQDASSEEFSQSPRGETVYSVLGLSINVPQPELESAILDQLRPGLPAGTTLMEVIEKETRDTKNLVEVDDRIRKFLERKFGAQQKALTIGKKNRENQRRIDSQNAEALQPLKNSLLQKRLSQPEVFDQDRDLADRHKPSSPQTNQRDAATRLMRAKQKLVGKIEYEMSVDSINTIEELKNKMKELRRNRGEKAYKTQVQEDFTKYGEDHPLYREIIDKNPVSMKQEKSAFNKTLEKAILKKITNKVDLTGVKQQNNVPPSESDDFFMTGLDQSSRADNDEQKTRKEQRFELERKQIKQLLSLQQYNEEKNISKKVSVLKAYRALKDKLQDQSQMSSFILSPTNFEPDESCPKDKLTNPFFNGRIKRQISVLKRAQSEEKTADWSVLSTTTTRTRDGNFVVCEQVQKEEQEVIKQRMCQSVRMLRQARDQINFNQTRRQINAFHKEYPKKRPYYDLKKRDLMIPMKMLEDSSYELSEYSKSTTQLALDQPLEVGALEIYKPRIEKKKLVSALPSCPMSESPVESQKTKMTQERQKSMQELSTYMSREKLVPTMSRNPSKPLALPAPDGTGTQYKMDDTDTRGSPTGNRTTAVQVEKSPSTSNLEMPEMAVVIMPQSRGGAPRPPKTSYNKRNSHFQKSQQEFAKLCQQFKRFSMSKGMGLSVDLENVNVNLETRQNHTSAGRRNIEMALTQNIFLSSGNAPTQSQSIRDRRKSVISSEDKQLEKQAFFDFQSRKKGTDSSQTNVIEEEEQPRKASPQQKTTKSSIDMAEYIGGLQRSIVLNSRLNNRDDLDRKKFELQLSTEYRNKKKMTNENEVDQEHKVEMGTNIDLDDYQSISNVNKTDDSPYRRMASILKNEHIVAATPDSLRHQIQPTIQRFHVAPAPERPLPDFTRKITNFQAQQQNHRSEVPQRYSRKSIFDNVKKVSKKGMLRGKMSVSPNDSKSPQNYNSRNNELSIRGTQTYSSIRKKEVASDPSMVIDVNVSGAFSNQYILQHQRSVQKDTMTQSRFVSRKTSKYPNIGEILKDSKRKSIDSIKLSSEI